MNNQFVENGQENIHQHFFTPENIKPTFDGQIEADDNDPQKLIDYLYVDTTPGIRPITAERPKSRDGTIR